MQGNPFGGVAGETTRRFRKASTKQSAGVGAPSAIKNGAQGSCVRPGPPAAPTPKPNAAQPSKKRYDARPDLVLSS